MSYEGRYQVICANGHYDEIDCYAHSDSAVCEQCKAKIVWTNRVDDTNGLADGYINVEYTVTKQCDHCGSVLEMRAEIPKSL